MTAAPIIRIVDDDPNIHDALAYVLENEGFIVRHYESAESFLINDRPEDPGCAILDVRMGEMSGIVLHDRMKKLGSKLPCIFLSAHGDVDMAVDAIEAGAVTFLSKPVRTEKLLAAIERALLTKIFNEKTEQHALTKHYEKGLTCVTCHDQQRVGGPDWMTSVTAPEMKKECGDCHETQKAVFAKTDTHQKITCVACHMPNIPSPEDFTGPDAVEQYYSAVRRSHLYRINTDPTAQTLIRSDAKEGSGERLWTYALDKKGHAYVDIVWSCGRAAPGDYTLSGDGQGCHSPATSTLDEGLRYGTQQAIYDEIQKWQEPVKAKFAEIEKGLERIKQLLEVTKLTPEELAEVHLMLDKAQEIYDQVKKDGSWGVHAPRYLLDRVTSGAAYIVRAQAIVDNGGYQTAADKRAAKKKAAK